jgi:hypothetical protein
VVGVVRVDLDELLVLGLATTLQVRVAQVEAVLVDLDVRADDIGAVAAAAREVGVRLLRVAGIVIAGLTELERGEPGKQTFLHIGHLVVDAELSRRRRTATNAELHQH